MAECSSSSTKTFDSKRASDSVRMDSKVAGADTVKKCGNSVRETDETCDDGNTQNEDGCSALCTVERSWKCGKNTTLDVIIGPDVCCECTDAKCSFLLNMQFPHSSKFGRTSRASGDINAAMATYSSNCPESILRRSIGVNCTCGNSFRDPLEACDDGNVLSGDGCSSSCSVEASWLCSGGSAFAGPDVCIFVFTSENGIFLASNQGLKSSRQCIIKPSSGGWLQFRLVASSCSVSVNLYECTDAGVGCTSQMYLGYSDSGLGKSYRTSRAGSYVKATMTSYSSNCPDSDGLRWSIAVNNTCGDSFRDPLEACDDGNVLSGDGCSSSCTVEASWLCSGGSAFAGPDVCIFVYTSDSGIFRISTSFSTSAFIKPSGGGWLQLRLVASSCTLSSNLYECTDSGVGCTPLSYLYSSGSIKSVKTSLAGSYVKATIMMNTYIPSCHADDGLHWSIAVNNTCGDSFRDPLEACDDGNVLSGDGCSSSCTVEASWLCSGGSAFAGPDACIFVFTSENGIFLASNQGLILSRQCIIKPSSGGWLQFRLVASSCSVSVNLYECTDAGVECTSQMYLGYYDSGSGKSYRTSRAGSYVKATMTSYSSNCPDSDGLRWSIAVINTCGDSFRDPLEACDDGNVLSGDGCSSSCTVEASWLCSGGSAFAGPDACIFVYMSDSGIYQTSAESYNSFGFRTQCIIKPSGGGWLQLRLVTSSCSLYSNLYECTDAGLGCVFLIDMRTDDPKSKKSVRTSRAGSYVRAELISYYSKCLESDGLRWSIAVNNTCGDSFRDPLEACDDGNVLSGDGCSSSCTVEASWLCSGGSAFAGRDECGFVYTLDSGFFRISSVSLNPTALFQSVYIKPSSGGWLQLSLLASSCLFSVDLFECADTGLGCSRLTYLGYSGLDVIFEESVRTSMAGRYVKAILTSYASNCLANDGLRWSVAVINTCGDSFRDPLEACDDGNVLSGDGCSSSCTVEVSWLCSGGSAFAGPDACIFVYTSDSGIILTSSVNSISASSSPSRIIKPSSGGWLQMRMVGITCSLFLDLYECKATRCSYLTYLGNSTLAIRTRQADSYVEVAVRSYSSNCLANDGLRWSIAISNNTCGDSFRDPLEACDDGNVLSGDGCSSSCTVEISWLCSGGSAFAGPDVCSFIFTSDSGVFRTTPVTSGSTASSLSLYIKPSSGGLLQLRLVGMMCFLTMDLFECTDADCRYLMYLVSSNPGKSARTSRAGNFFKAAMTSYSSNCPDSDGLRWSIAAINTCGDSFRDPLEACDDGNVLSGDGCSSSCTVEASWLCSGGNVRIGPDVCIFVYTSDSGVFRISTANSSFAASQQSIYIKPSSGGWLQLRREDVSCAGSIHLYECTDATYYAGCFFLKHLIDFRCGNFVRTSRSGSYVKATITLSSFSSDCPASDGLRWNITVVNTCGDSFRDPLEACDDGNVLSGDGCSSSCTVEASWLCSSGSAFAGPDVCGIVFTSDSGIFLSSAISSSHYGSSQPYLLIVKPSSGGWLQLSLIDSTCSFPLDPHECTDDGCSVQSLRTHLESPGSAKSVRTSRAGSYVKATVNMSSHSSNCLESSGLRWSIVVSNSCSNRFRDPFEECDDGNMLSGDGCSSSCIVEASWLCSGGSVRAGPDVCSFVFTADSGVFQTSTVSYSPTASSQSVFIKPSSGGWLQLIRLRLLSISCSFSLDLYECTDAACTVPLHQRLTKSAQSVRTSRAGSYVKVKLISYSSNCSNSDGLSWDIAVANTCGDSFRDPLEACDDGNVLSGDGCSSSCTVEASWLCSGGSVRAGPDVCIIVYTSDQGIFRSSTNTSSSESLEFEPSQSVYIRPSSGGWLQLSLLVICTGRVEIFECTGTGCLYLMYLGASMKKSIRTSRAGNYIKATRTSIFHNTVDSKCSASVDIRWSIVCCNNTCGDSFRDPLEACDDGNVQSGDGCSSSCTVEASCSGGSEFAGPDVCSFVFASDAGAWKSPASATTATDYSFYIKPSSGGWLQLQLTNYTCCASVFVSGIDPLGLSANLDLGVQTVKFFGGPTNIGSALRSSTSGTSLIVILQSSSDPVSVGVSWSFVTSLSIICGNGFRDSLEACDDGNVLSGDGCSSSCMVETSWLCSGGSALAGPDVCYPVFTAEFGQLQSPKLKSSIHVLNWYIKPSSGGWLQLRMIALTCCASIIIDECPAVCLSNLPPLSESNMIFPGKNTIRTSKPGLGYFIRMKATISSASFEISWSIAGNKVCGNSFRDPLEACDDGNVLSGDGCSSLCTVEASWLCSGGSAYAGPDVCYPVFTSDAGAWQSPAINSTATDFAWYIKPSSGGWLQLKLSAYICCASVNVCESSSCFDQTLLQNQALFNIGSAIRTSQPGNYFAIIMRTTTTTAHFGINWSIAIANTCGDSFRDPLEACDDGNVLSGDGCSSSCTVEASWLCSGGSARAGPDVCGVVFTSDSGEISFPESVTGGISACYVKPISSGWLQLKVTAHSCCSVVSVYECLDADCISYSLAFTGAFKIGSAFRTRLNSVIKISFRPSYVDSVNPSTSFVWNLTVKRECGDSFRDPFEVCDDGNLEGGDGCSTSCTNEAAWTCAGANANMGPDLCFQTFASLYTSSAFLPSISADTTPTSSSVQKKIANFTAGHLLSADTTPALSNIQAKVANVTSGQSVLIFTANQAARAGGSITSCYEQLMWSCSIFLCSVISVLQYRDVVA